MAGCRTFPACTDNGFLLFIRSVPQCTPQGVRCQKHDSQYRAVCKETGEKEVHLLEQKGYERMVNEIVPVQQAEAYRKPTNKAVKEDVKELNPDTNSLGSRG